MSLTVAQKLLSAYLLLLVIFWVFLQQSGLQTSFWNYFYSFAFSLIPLLGGIYGLFLAKPWGFLDSSIGRAICYISLGLFSWGVGSMIWSYYNFFERLAAPYPSVADVGFIAAIPLWIVGVVNLSQATGVRFALQNIKGKLFLLIVPILIFIVSYYLLVYVARGGVISESTDDLMKLFFDFAYPIGDVAILALATVILGLSLNYFGGLFKVPIIALLAGFGVMYLADFVFSYTTTIETFYNGNFGDLLFTLALFLMTFGVLGFNNLKGESGDK